MKPETLICKKQIGQHLSLLYEQACEEHGAYFNIFTLMDRRSRFFNSVEGAIDYCALRAAEGQNVYCGMGLFSKPIENGRGSVVDTIGITGLWSDVDVTNPDTEKAHKSKKYASSTEDALWVSSVGGHKPGYYVDSGNGIHPYWPFHEPLMFEDKSHSHDVGILVQRWQGSIKMRAQEKDWIIDGTHDLVRVLRVAGTINWKDKSNPKKVVLHASDKILGFDLDEMEDSMIAVEYLNVGSGYRALADVSSFVIDPDESIDPNVINAACANSADFKETWSRNRSDLGDQSPSAYDFALTNYFVRMGLDDQTIVNALIQWRREHHQTSKLRVDYYQRTIGKVRATVDQIQTLASVETTAHELPEVDDVSLLSRKDKQRYLKDIQAMLRINIKRFIQVNLDDASYFFELENGDRFSIGGVHQLVECRLFRERIAERMGILLDNTEIKDKWGIITKLLFAIREYEETAEQTTADTCRSLIIEYLDSSKMYTDEEWQKALRASHPFLREGLVYINTDAFITWVRVNRGARVNARDAIRDFKLLGMESSRVEGRDRSERKNRTYWSSSESDWPEIFSFVEPGHVGVAV